MTKISEKKAKRAYQAPMITHEDAFERVSLAGCTSSNAGCVTPGAFAGAPTGCTSSSGLAPCD